MKNDEGAAMVEATLILPFCIIMILALYYVSIFMCQKANLQANLQNTLVYYKNTYSDTYVETSSSMSYTTDDGTQTGEGSSYGTPSQLFPYRFFGMEFSDSEFTAFFKSMCGNMFFDTGDNVTVEATTTNYVIYKKITATATQTVTPAISLSMVGVSSSLTIEVSGEAIVTDSDDLIRNVDFAIDLVEDTALGKKATEMVDKAVSLYNKFKSAFNIS